MNVFEKASSLEDGEHMYVEIGAKVIEINVYQGDIYDLKVTQKHIPIMRRFSKILSFDVKVMTKFGIIKFKLNPLLSDIQKGKLYKSQLISISKFTKIVRDPFYFFMLDEYKSTEEITNFSDAVIELPLYKRIDIPLGGRIGTTYLDLMTLVDIAPNQVDHTNRIKTLSPDMLNKLNIISLQSLDENWINYNSNRDILARVISKSKVKTLQPKHDEGVGLLVNFLIADNSGLVVLTAFDSAALEFNASVSENDIILIRSYKIHLLKEKHGHPLYSLIPKRKVNLATTTIELKINEQDLCQIYKCDRLESPYSNTVASPNWAFRSASTISDSNSNRKLTDFIGVIMEFGRIEREQMVRQDHLFTYWYRQWIKLYDNSSECSVLAKLYLCPSNRNKLQTTIPGDIVILTHMGIIHTNGTNYLISTNETSVFVNNDFELPKFAILKVIIDNLKSDVLKYSNKKWTERYKSASIGRYIYPFNEAVSLNKLNIYFDKKFQIVAFLKKLHSKMVKRFVIRASLVGTISYARKMDLLETNVASILGHLEPQNLPAKVYGLSRTEILKIKCLTEQLHSQVNLI